MSFRLKNVVIFLKKIVFILVGNLLFLNFISNFRKQTNSAQPKVRKQTSFLLGGKIHTVILQSKALELFLGIPCLFLWSLFSTETRWCMVVVITVNY